MAIVIARWTYELVFGTFILAFGVIAGSLWELRADKRADKEWEAMENERFRYEAADEDDGEEWLES